MRYLWCQGADMEDQVRHSRSAGKVHVVPVIAMVVGAVFIGLRGDDHLMVQCLISVEILVMKEWLVVGLMMSWCEARRALLTFLVNQQPRLRYLPLVVKSKHDPCVHTKVAQHAIVAWLQS